MLEFQEYPKILDLWTSKPSLLRLTFHLTISPNKYYKQQTEERCSDSEHARRASHRSTDSRPTRKITKSSNCPFLPLRPTFLLEFRRAGTYLYIFLRLQLKKCGIILGFALEFRPMNVSLIVIDTLNVLLPRLVCV